VRSVSAALADGAYLHRITAQGRYTAGSDTLTTVRANFVLGAADDGGDGG
jgi:hypothetical protein